MTHVGVIGAYADADRTGTVKNSSVTQRFLTYKVDRQTSNQCAKSPSAPHALLSPSLQTFGHIVDLEILY